MKVLNRPMFRYGGPIKEGIMSGIKEPRRQGYAQPPSFVIQNDPNKLAVDKALQNFLSEGSLSGTGKGWGEGTYDPTKVNLPSTDVITVSLSAIMQQPEYANMTEQEIKAQAAMQTSPRINLIP